jgi:hypothetical protein
MSDAYDAVARAVAANRKLAASLLVRKQELEAAGAPTPELAAVEAQLKAALAELAQLQKLGKDLPAAEARALVQAAAESDPLIRTPEERALDNARAHLAELEGGLRLSEELADRPAAPRPPTPAEAEADARIELERLRAKLPPKP